jgi:hypothetical protein
MFPSFITYYALAVWRNLAQVASTATDAQITKIASICQAVSSWLKNTTARKAAITGFRKKS